MMNHVELHRTGIHHCEQHIQKVPSKIFISMNFMYTAILMSCKFNLNGRLSRGEVYNYIDLHISLHLRERVILVFFQYNDPTVNLYGFMEKLQETTGDQRCVVPECSTGILNFHK